MGGGGVGVIHSSVQSLYKTLHYRHVSFGKDRAKLAEVCTRDDMLHHPFVKKTGY